MSLNKTKSGKNGDVFLIVTKVYTYKETTHSSNSGVTKHVSLNEDKSPDVFVSPPHKAK